MKCFGCGEFIYDSATTTRMMTTKKTTGCYRLLLALGARCLPSTVLVAVFIIGAVE